ncbi:MAG: hypothetical protein A2V83_06550 [Nitrospirae bacterium RBG_16_64_22]|nr:MAG: hypothetical protein A2V83_06550 [Nitrospirae bacterium RBG_16_64_22]
MNRAVRRNPRPKPWFCGVLTAGLLLLSLGCARETDEARIGRAIDEIVQAIETKESGKAVARLAEDYRDFEGRTPAETRGFLLLHFRRNPKIRIYILAQSIRVEGNSANVRSHVAAVGVEEIVPERGEAYLVSSRWERRNGEWKTVYASWTPSLTGGGDPLPPPEAGP